jgi:putative transposase
MELAMRRGEIAGITPHPTEAFMQQCTRQLTDPFDGFLLGTRYLLHDRDTNFTRVFDALLKDSGVDSIVLPARSPNLNAYCERFVRSIKEEALDQMVMLGEPSLSYAIQQYLGHYHTERYHQGLANHLIAAEPGLGSHSGQVRRRDRLGGLLRYYYRVSRRGVTQRYFSTIRDRYGGCPRSEPCHQPAVRVGRVTSAHDPLLTLPFVFATQPLPEYTNVS